VPSFLSLAAVVPGTVAAGVGLDSAVDSALVAEAPAAALAPLLNALLDQSAGPSADPSADQASEASGGLAPLARDVAGLPGASAVRLRLSWASGSSGGGGGSSGGSGGALRLVAWGEAVGAEGARGVGEAVAARLALLGPVRSGGLGSEGGGAVAAWGSEVMAALDGTPKVLTRRRATEQHLPVQEQPGEQAELRVLFPLKAASSSGGAVGASESGLGTVAPRGRALDEFGYYRAHCATGSDDWVRVKRRSTARLLFICCIHGLGRGLSLVAHAFTAPSRIRTLPIRRDLAFPGCGDAARVWRIDGSCELAPLQQLPGLPHFRLLSQLPLLPT